MRPKSNSSWLPPAPMKVDGYGSQLPARTLRATADFHALRAEPWRLSDDAQFAILRRTREFAAMLIFAVGECLHGVVQAPLSVDLAPPRLVGRYLAASSISWQIGWIVGPAAGGLLLQHRPLVLWPLAAGANLVFAALALRLERDRPANVRRSPHPETPVVAPSPSG